MSIIIKALAKLTHDNSGSLEFVHKTVKNWHDVLLLLAGTRKKIRVHLRNGRSYSIKVVENYVVSNFRNRPLAFLYRTNDERTHVILMTIGEFFDEPHSLLDVKGRSVLDIGAYIGDTPIYFAMNGAKHVYGMEPYPYSFDLAKKNISANNLDKKITMINAGCGSKSDKIKIEKDYKNLAGSDLKFSKKGKSVPIIPLQTLVKKYKLKNAALKIDCEGCEYDIVIKSKDEILRNFSRILIEYHYGYQDIEKRLKKAGFRVRHTEPEYMKNVNAAKKDMQGGTIYAELVN